MKLTRVSSLPRTHLVYCLALLGGASCLAAPAKNMAKATPPVKREFVELVRNHQPNSCLVIDSRRYTLKEDRTNKWAILDRPISSIAATVQDYVLKGTGAKLPILDLASAKPPLGKILIYIGRTDYVERTVGKELAGVDPTGYLIRAIDDKHVIIAGPSSEGTEFGTYEFLERFAGIRWLMPTDVGDYVPKRASLALPLSTRLRDEPAFMQVPVLAVQTPQQTWARRMRFHTRISFHHNLVNLFPPAVYTGTHPEFYPVLKAGDTQRYLPTGNVEDWQPCFTAPGIVDEAARNVIKFLDDNPTVKTYSFGVNDSFNFCQCENCRKEYIEGAGLFDYPSYSEPYYKFVSAVIEKVLKVHPDAWFGCLAYINVSAPPVKEKVSPRLIPFLTYDSMQTIDPERRKMHEELVRAWNAKATFLGRYDYTYGDSFVPPRIYIHHWADYVRWARAHKFKAWYAETYPFFGEAPKYYVMAKIWWNPDRDVDQLLNEWYRLSFGKAAAPMKAYFDHWENYWTTRVPQSDYFRLTKNYQFLMGGRGWLEKLNENDVKQADGWIAQAEKTADTPETKARVRVMARSWEYYRSIITTYLARQNGNVTVPVEGALNLLRYTKRNGDSVYDSLKNDPILSFTWVHPYSPYGDLQRNRTLDALETWFNTRDDRLAARLRTLATGADEPFAAVAQTALDIVSGDAPNIVPNSSFEAANPLDGWWADIHEGTGKVRLSETQPWEGAHAVQVSGTYDGYGGVMRRDVPVQSGKRYLFLTRARWDGPVSPTTTFQMSTYYLNADGGEMAATLRSNAFRCDNQWRTFAMETAAAPPEAKTMVVRVDVKSQPQTGNVAYIDGVQVFELRGKNQIDVGRSAKAPIP